MKTKLLLALINLNALVLMVFSPARVFGQADPAGDACVGVGAVGGNCDDSQEDVDNFVLDVVNILLFVVGVASVIMLIIGGIRYVVSGGDQNAVSGAKNTIMYAVIGIVVASSAFLIANFVLEGLFNSNQPSSGGGSRLL